ncbi:hypothetical protein, partial [Serratia marcescens]|uniref:hypothetical protein n=1 Tax=Serratia marcescens TaxID=615 RepID=UPI001953BB92
FRELVTNLRQQISGLITDKANLSAVILRLTQDRLEAQQETARYKRGLDASPPGCPFDRAIVDLNTDQPCPICGMTGTAT